MQLDISRGKLVIQASQEEWGKMWEQLSGSAGFPVNELLFAVHTIMQQEAL